MLYSNTGVFVHRRMPKYLSIFNTRISITELAATAARTALLSILLLTLLAWGMNSDGKTRTRMKLKRELFHYDTFPPSFEWGVSTSSYQVEGGWDQDGKGENIWDNFTHAVPSHMVDGTNGDVACDSYNNIEKDVEMISSQVSAKVYRFSLSWARLLPSGRKATLNKKGVAYYNKLIDSLIAKGVRPIVTLYHWDLPQNFQNDFGGWTDSAIVDKFGDYAEICFGLFGDRVKQWVTINEPRTVAVEGHEQGDMAPGYKTKGTLVYTVSRNLILAHARAYHIYDESYRKTQRGKVGLALNCDWRFPVDPSNTDDRDAADRFLQQQIGLYAHPVYIGDWPAVLKTKIATKSVKEGLPASRLPNFTESEIKYVKGTADFFGLNTYTARRVANKVNDDPGFYSDGDYLATVDPSWPSTASSWLKLSPWAIEPLLLWVKEEYPNYSEIFIMENGLSNSASDPVQLCDKQRYNHIIETTNYMLKAIRLGGVRVSGYMHWSLMDNFEWARGYTEKFGLFYVDFKRPDRPRYAKASVHVYKKIIESNGFPKQNVVQKWRNQAEKICQDQNKQLHNSTSCLSVSTVILLLIELFFLVFL